METRLTDVYKVVRSHPDGFLISSYAEYPLRLTYAVDSWTVPSIGKIVAFSDKAHAIDWMREWKHIWGDIFQLWHAEAHNVTEIETLAQYPNDEINGMNMVNFIWLGANWRTKWQLLQYAQELPDNFQWYYLFKPPMHTVACDKLMLKDRLA